MHGLYDRDRNRYIERDLESEENALTLLNTLSIKRGSQYSEMFRLTPRNLPRAVNGLLANGWRVEAEGKLYRNPGSSSLSVSSGIDWFELHGSLNFGEDLEVKLPQLLAALRRGQKVIALGDGSFGVLPEEWLQQYDFLASFGATEEDHLRFQRTQTGVLDALLAARPEITCDETFARVRKEWQNFNGIKPSRQRHADLWANFEIISAKAWVGLSFSSDSSLADVSRMTWGWVRQFKYSRYWNRDATETLDLRW